MKVYYNQNLKVNARVLRNDSTASEIKLWNFLRNKQMKGYLFNRQKPILNYIADFYSNKLKLVIELDGYSHNLEEEYEKDLQKDLEFKKIGFKILRFEDNEVMKNIENVLKAIENYIEDFEKSEEEHPTNPLL